MCTYEHQKPQGKVSTLSLRRTGKHTDITVPIECIFKIENVTVESLRLNETDLDTKRMFDLMAVSGEDQMPIYLHVVRRILREMRIADQKLGDLAGGFEYAESKRKIEDEGFTGLQSGPLNQRLETLGSFVDCRVKLKGQNVKIKVSKGTDWEREVCV